MIDPKPAGSGRHGVTLEQLANQLGRPFQGDPQTTVSGVATLANAAPHQLSFLANPSYARFLAECQAGIVILGDHFVLQFNGAMLISPEPYADYARAAAHFDPGHQFAAGVHASAVVADTAVLAAGCGIGAHVVVGPDCHVGANSWIGPGCVLDSGCRIGEGSVLTARVTLGREVKIGKRVIIHAGAVIGADGFGIAMSDGHWLKVPQLGSVRIGDDCEIGANTTIDRGAIDDTRLGVDVRLDNQIQIGHNVIIGDHTAIAGCAAVAGSAKIGSYCLIGGGAGVVGHIEICDRVTVTAMTLVTRNISKPGDYSSGSPLQDTRSWRRNAVRIRQLDGLARRVEKLEKK